MGIPEFLTNRVPRRRRARELRKRGEKENLISLSPLRMSIGFLEQKAAQPRRGVRSIQRSLGNPERQVFPIVTIRNERESVQSKKYETSSQRCSLVSIDERMVAAEVKQISRCDIDRIAERRHTAETCLRSSDGGFQKRTIPKTFGTAELRDGFNMDLGKNFNRQMKAIVRGIPHARRFMVLEYRFIVSLMRDVISSRGGIGTIGETVIVPPACTSTFTSSPTFKRASCRSAESKMIP
jgi:hypothetical protein